MIRYEMKIDKEGKIVTEVLHRDTEGECAKILGVTAGLGKQVSDEPIGPGCDPAFERTVQ